MTGTPAKLTSLADGLRSLHGLLKFVRHPVANSHAAWRALAGPVERAGVDGDDAASEGLAMLLRECMVRNTNMLAYGRGSRLLPVSRKACPLPPCIRTPPNLPYAFQVRHRKCDVSVPDPIRVTRMLKCSVEERLAYNTVVGYAKG